MKYQTPKLESINIEVMSDYDADLNYLTQDYAECAPEEQAQYKEQDAKRLSNCGITWNPIGIKAIAIIMFPFPVITAKGKETHYLSQEIESGGLWGIESDGGESYINEVKEEQIADLKEMLKALGIKIPDNLELGEEKCS